MTAPVSGVLDPAELAAWCDRRTPRDPYDMWSLSAEGLIDAEAAALFRRHGPHTRVTDADVARLVTQDLRMSSLGHQCRPRVSAEEAKEVVESAWRSAAHE